MRKKSRIEMAAIVNSVKREMQRPRETESVRNGLSVQTVAPVNGSPAKRF
jgi:hypothetical protein